MTMADPLRHRSSAPTETQPRTNPCGVRHENRPATVAARRRLLSPVQPSNRYSSASQDKIAHAAGPIKAGGAERGLAASRRLLKPTAVLVIRGGSSEAAEQPHVLYGWRYTRTAARRRGASDSIVPAAKPVRGPVARTPATSHVALQ